MAGTVVRINMDVRVDGSGLDDYIRRLEAAEAVVLKYVRIAYDIARRNARVDTGAMRDSIKYEVVREGMDQIMWELSVGEGLPDERAWWNEYGTSRMPAQSMIRVALEQIREPMMLELEALMHGEGFVIGRG